MQEQQLFVTKFLSHVIKGGKYAFFDSTSLHVWNKSARTWRYSDHLHPDRQFSCNLQRQRGKSINIQGILCDDGRFYNAITEKTDGVNIRMFFEKHIRNMSGYVLVLDNFGCHHMPETIHCLEKLGITPFFLPVNSSPLNSIETMWACCKSRFHKWLFR